MDGWMDKHTYETGGNRATHGHFAVQKTGA